MKKQTRMIVAIHLDYVIYEDRQIQAIMDDVSYAFEDYGIVEVHMLNPEDYEVNLRQPESDESEAE